MDTVKRKRFDGAFQGAGMARGLVGERWNITAFSVTIGIIYKSVTVIAPGCKGLRLLYASDNIRAHGLPNEQRDIEYKKGIHFCGIFLFIPFFIGNAPSMDDC
jgi:hypothetical protein